MCMCIVPWPRRTRLAFSFSRLNVWQFQRLAFDDWRLAFDDCRLAFDDWRLAFDD